MSDNLPPSYPQEIKANNDELDLVGLIKILLDGKWTILKITAFCSLVALATLWAAPSTFKATTAIKPISKVAADAYAQSNAMGFFVIEQDALLDDFIDLLEDRQLFIDATKELSLVRREDFVSEESYQESVVEFVESLELLPPINEDGLLRGVSRRNWELVVRYDDKVKWLQALRYVARAANAEIGSVLRERFASAVIVAEARREFELQDLEMSIVNTQADYDIQMEEFEARLTFDLEDTSTKIDNAIADYDRTSSDRLAFLREQAAIARTLGVAKNTIEAQTFSAQNSILASVKTDTPFYLRGYEAIEKEIELMESRTDKRAFVVGLLDLEKTKRRLEQDRTLQRQEVEKQYLESRLKLEQQVRALEQDQTVARAKMMFESTPAFTGFGFEAARFTPEGTSFEPITSKLRAGVLVGLLSGMLASVYVLVASAVRSSRASES